MEEKLKKNIKILYVYGIVLAIIPINYILLPIHVFKLTGNVQKYKR